MFGLNPVKMTIGNNASSWTGNRKTLQKSPTKSANSQGAKEGEVVEEEKRGHIDISHRAQRKRNQTTRKPQECWT